MNLSDLGYNSSFEEFRTQNGLSGLEVGRVIAEHRERYVLSSASGEFDAEITGNMRFSAEGREDFPAVGDWVAFAPCDPGFAIIHKIFPRFSVLKRQAVDRFGEVQVIAANIDYALLVQSADRDFNINRLERYLAICHSSGVGPVVVLTKTDLVDEAAFSGILAALNERLAGVPVFALSNLTGRGCDAVKDFLQKGKTFCMLGSSGVGKSSLLNNLSGRELMRTGSISESTGKGRHVTSHRELIVLESGGILIDNPGMREVGAVASDNGLEATFDAIGELAPRCRFRDCSHVDTAGCAVLEAVEKGVLSRGLYENYLKMAREKAHFESTVSERREKDRKFGKMMKNYQKEMKKKGH